MPEGPQMIFIKEEAEHFVGQQVINAEGNASGIPFDKIVGQHLSEVRTFGKELLFCFPAFTIRIHLMLFGKYAINHDLERKLTLRLEFEKGTINFYASNCRFISGSLDQFYDWSQDVMNNSFDNKKALENLLKKPQLLISDSLLDQQTLAGVGNKIKNEVLFRLQVHPESTVGEIPDPILLKIIEECTTFSFQYLNWMHDGTEKEHLQVYRKEICHRDQIPIRKEKIGKTGRTCYFCDKCQMLYSPHKL